MVLIITLLPFLLANVGAENPSITRLLGMETVFQEVHNTTIGGLEWDTDLANRAYRKSRRLQHTDFKWEEKKKQLVLIGNSKLGEIEEPEEKLSTSLKRLLQEYDKQVHSLFLSSPHYGCGGYVIKLQGGPRSLHYACLYSTLEYTTESTEKTLNIL